MKSPDPRKRLVTSEEAAETARVQESTIRDWVRRGILTPTARQGRKNLFLEADVYKAERHSRQRRRRKARAA